MNISSFIRSFRTCFGGARGECKCGRVFYDNSHDGGWDWEDGELEELGKNPDATAIYGTVCHVQIFGIEYVAECDCWDTKAKDLMKFIDANAQEIATYLKIEKERKLTEAKSMPTVD